MLHIQLTDTQSGETRVYDDDLEWYGSFVWEEGNFACDCNRYLFFQRARDEDEDDEPKCGDWRYRIDYIKDDSGLVLYEEK